MKLDFSQDYAVWDNPEAVTLEAQTTPGIYFPQAVAIALRSQPTEAERMPTQGVYAGFDLDWELPGPLCGKATPKPGDRVLDGAGSFWTILTVQFDQMDQVYHCHGVNLILANGLTDTIDIQRAALIYDATGGVQRQWPPVGAGTIPYPGLAARVQLQEQTEARERGLRGQQYTYQVVLAQQVALTAEDRIKWTPAGTANVPAGLGAAPFYLTIKGLHNPSRIDELPVIDAYLSV